MAEDCELTSSIPSLANYDNGLESPGMTPPPDPCKDSSSTLTGKRGHFLTESQGSAQNMPDVMFELEGGPPADPEYLCMHPEYHQDKQRQASREFLENRTPFKFYVATASVFLDLVFDEETSSKMAGHRRSIRLRIQSRKRKPVTSSSTGLPVPSEYSMKSEEAYPYVDMPTKLWPPNEASEELLTMINPYPNGQVVAAFADERRVIYMVRNPQSGSSSNNAIVLINFDPPPGREESQAKEEEKSTSRSCQGMKHVKKGVMVLPQDPLGTSPEKAIGPDRLILR
ncbi:hypothetical protein MMC25_000318 [Agyrium rufum]|nr:hypothetical protein [Agyrium rufum]